MINEERRDFRRRPIDMLSADERKRLDDWRDDVQAWRDAVREDFEDGASICLDSKTFSGSAIAPDPPQDAKLITVDADAYLCEPGDSYMWTWEGAKNWYYSAQFPPDSYCRR